MRLAGKVAYMGRGKVYIEFWQRNLRERDHLENLGVDRIILKWIFRKYDGGMDCIDLTQNRDG